MKQKVKVLIREIAGRKSKKRIKSININIKKTSILNLKKKLRNKIKTNRKVNHKFNNKKVIKPWKRK